MFRSDSLLATFLGKGVGRAHIVVDVPFSDAVPFRGEAT